MNAMTEDYKYDEEEKTDGFKIDSVAKANWAITKIKEEQARSDMFIESCKMKISEVNDRIQNERVRLEDNTAWLKQQLAEYIKTAPAKKAKNSMSLQLEGGTIRLKYSLPQYKYDESELIEKLKDTDYVEDKQSLKWGEFKKLLAPLGDIVIRTDTGEVVNSVTLEYSPERVEIE